MNYTQDKDGNVVTTTTSIVNVDYIIAQINSFKFTRDEAQKSIDDLVQQLSDIGAQIPAIVDTVSIIPEVADTLNTAKITPPQTLQ